MKIKNQCGFSLVEVMTATALMTVAGMSLIGLSRLANQDSLQLRTVRVASMARTQIEAALKNPVAWQKTRTVANNSSFACTDPSGSGCGPAPTTDGYYDFVLFGPGGEKITYDPADPTTRYSIQGGPCQAGTPSPSSLCPIKYVARWKPLCQTATCLNPTMDIKIDLQLEFGDQAPPLDPSKYSYGVVRGLDDGSLQSACQILNGIYNSSTGTCRPRNANKTCSGAQIVTAVDSNGNITCSPLYKGNCAAGQVMTGVDASGNAQCGTRATPATCPKPCVGTWGACSTLCGGPGTRYYTVITPPMFGGLACPNNNGDSQPCDNGPCPANCVGKWMGCSAPCGGGIDTYKVLSPKVGTGLDCPYTDGDTQVCNTAACAASVDCGGYWNACDPSTGTKTFTITQAPSGGGAACPAPLTQTCPVDCVGNWGACVSGSKTFTWSIPALNGGIACTFANGQTDTTGCATTPGPPPASRICNGSDLACSVWLGCDFGMESWFQQLSPTTGILHYHVNSSCQTPYYRATPYIWDGSAWVPSGAPTSSGGIPRSPCIHPC